MLKLSNVSCGYNNINVVNDIEFQVEKGEILSIVGPNGCGKSTLLKAISNLIDYCGNITIDSMEIKDLKRKELAKKVALMSQSSNIYFSYTVYETVALGRYPYLEGVFSKLKREDEEIVLKSINSTGLADVKDKFINELSGGQLQRVYLARAFAQNPDILLLDEPTNHLDLKYQIEILQHVKSWAKEKNKIVIAVLHDLNLVQIFAENVIMLNKGKIIKSGTTKEVLERNILKEVYEIDVKKHMIDSLKTWEE